MTNQSLFVPRPRAGSSPEGAGARPRPSVRPGADDGVRARNRREKTATLADAALRLFLERGVEGVTVDAVVDAASIAKGSFYRYFPDLESLVVHLLAPLAEGVARAFDACDGALAAARSREDLVRAYETLAASLAAAILGAPDVVRLYLQESRGPASGARRPIAAIARDIRARAVRLTETAHAHALLKPIPAAITAHAVVGAAEELVFLGLTAPEALGGAELVGASLVELVLDGLRRR